MGKLLEQLESENWQEASCGNGSKGARVYDCQLMRINTPPLEGYVRHLLVRKSKSSGKLRAYICFAPADIPVLKLIQISGTRWTVEDSFAETKSQVGLDQYEVRSYDGWYKHITLACVTHALLTHISSLTSDLGSFQRYDPNHSSLEAFKKGRGLRA